jgi:hypothetical protein
MNVRNIRAFIWRFPRYTMRLLTRDIDDPSRRPIQYFEQPFVDTALKG